MLPFVTQKTPYSVRYYTLNWVDWLEGDTLVESTWVSSNSDLVIARTAMTDTLAIVWVSGGKNQVTYNITNLIQTATGQREAWTITIWCVGSEIESNPDILSGLDFSQANNSSLLLLLFDADGA